MKCSPHTSNNIDREHCGAKQFATHISVGNAAQWLQQQGESAGISRYMKGGDVRGNKEADEEGGT